LIHSANANTDSTASPHPLLIVLEPEAAGINCNHKMKSLFFEIHDKFLTADIGGGTIQEKLETGEDLDVRVSF
jgi:molecular chaperone DnaK (HSP70)